MAVTIIVFILILLALVLAHEWGHFYAARKAGVRVNEFGFGFPPRLFGFKKGETLYSINLLPLGGFVKLKGEQGEDREEPDSFVHQSASRRAVILVAGVLMNVILAWVLLTIGFSAGIPTVVDDETKPVARDVKIQILQVLPDSPAAQAGIEPGDTIATINGYDFISLQVMQDFIAGHKDNPLHFGIERGDQILEKDATPILLPTSGERAVIGVALIQTGTVTYPWYEAIWEGAKATWWLIYGTVAGFVMIIGNLIQGQGAGVEVAGPVGIAVLTGQVVSLGWLFVLQFAALLSVNLAIINILPFPALDGGRLLFVVIEKIRRKPNNDRVEAIVHTLGFAVLMLLVLVITYKDISRLGINLWQNVVSLFG